MRRRKKSHAALKNEIQTHDKKFNAKEENKMAKEIKSMQVHPSDEEETIKVWQTFGWELMGAPQEVNIADSHWEDNTHYYSQKGEHYVKLTFQRDNSIPNYARLAELQKQYDAVVYPEMPNPRFGHPLFNLFGFIPIGGWAILAAIGVLLYVVPGVLIIIWRCVSYSKKSNIWDAEYVSCNIKKKEIIEQAKGLVS
ncbi:MAG: hypothetical protein LBL45_00270 [Treponema sp.]|jgi:hypothetical protein|nr:hypothetical protein [Treponema sp.]